MIVEGEASAATWVLLAPEQLPIHSFYKLGQFIESGKASLPA